ncbi:MAG TPA: OsmC family protein [Gaiellaceae bacterium]|nr:OsmC family protein [Gaiellaceae bacterium]
MAVKAKELRYAVGLSATGELTEENGIALGTPPEWSPEHLLLAALIRCSLKSLRHHARRSDVEVRSASGGGRTLVTRRESDGRYAMVETDLDLVVELEPEPGSAALTGLLALAERDCFIGSSLTAEPTYRWTVNGRSTAP